MTKWQAMSVVSDLLKKERVKHHLETRMGADGKLVALEDVDCIHLTWFLDNALGELQIACTFRDKWLDILGFPDIYGGPIKISERGAEEVIRFLNEVNSRAKFGCAFYLDTKTHDIVCAGRIPYLLLERAPDYVVNMIDGIWEFFSDVGDELMETVLGWLTAHEAFHLVLDKGWEAQATAQRDNIREGARAPKKQAELVQRLQEELNRL